MVHQATRVVSARIPWSEYDNVVCGCGKDVRFRPAGREHPSWHKTGFCSPCFITVFRTPVAGDDHAAIRQGKCGGHCPLDRHYAGRGKAVGGRIVYLRAPTLAYTEIRFATTSKEYSPVWERCGKAVDVSVEHGDRVPSATGIVFGCSHRLEPVGLASKENNFVADNDGPVTATRSRKIRQTLNRHLLPLRTVRSGNDVPSGLSRGA